MGNPPLGAAPGECGHREEPGTIQDSPQPADELRVGYGLRRDSIEGVDGVMGLQEKAQEARQISDMDPGKGLSPGSQTPAEAQLEGQQVLLDAAWSNAQAPAHAQVTDHICSKRVAVPD